MIVILDYQMGNLRSVQKAFECKGYETLITDDVAAMRDASGVVLPGVGAFGDCYRELRSRRLVDPLLEWIYSGRPFLGICLGLQVLLTTSEESGSTPGLNVFPGWVRRFGKGELKVPHMGWNQVRYTTNGKAAPDRRCPLFEGVPDGSYFYFVHSYYVVPDDSTVVAGLTDYGVPFASVIWRDNVFATQFHPEKSQDAGLRLIGNFGKLVEQSAKRAHTEAIENESTA